MKPQEFLEKLMKYLKQHRREKRLIFKGIIYNNSIFNDAKVRFRNEIPIGRKSLIQAIMVHLAERELPEIDWTLEPQKLLESIERGYRENIRYIFRHYDTATLNSIRYLLIKKHNYARRLAQVEQKKPLVEWKDRLIELSDKGIQAEIYQYIYETAPDPIALRLAIAPQYWRQFNRYDMTNMVVSILGNYRAFAGISRSNDDHDAFLRSFGHSVKAIEGQIPDSVYSIYVNIYRYCKHLLSNGLAFRIPKEILIDHERTYFDRRILSEPWVYGLLQRFSAKNVKTCLMYGILTNPLQLLSFCYLKGNYDKGNFVIRSTAYMHDPMTYLDRFEFDEVWHGQK